MTTLSAPELATSLLRLQAALGDNTKGASFMPFPGQQQAQPQQPPMDPNQQAAMQAQQGQPPQGQPPMDPNQQAAMQAQQAPQDPIAMVMQQIEPVLQQFGQVVQSLTQAMQVLKQENQQQWQELQRIKESQMRAEVEMSMLKKAWESAQDMPMGLGGMQMQPAGYPGQ